MQILLTLICNCNKRLSDVEFSFAELQLQFPHKRSNILMMKELESNYFDSKEAFRNWLVTNHDKSPGFWMIFYKTAQKNTMSELGFTGLNDSQDYPIGSWESKKSGKSWFRHLPGRGRFSLR